MSTTNHPTLLIIAGSDPSGGAGLQTDIKVATLHGVYSSCVPTCLTAQNTLQVAEIHNPPIEFLQKQIAMLFADIKFDVIKIGMLGTKEITNSVRELIKSKSPQSKVVIDPVMVATSGDLLLKEDALEALKNFIKDAFLLTPNLDEAQILTKKKIKSLDEMKAAAHEIQRLGAKNVLLKGGHLDGDDNGNIHNILLSENGEILVISNQKISGVAIHGTGCSLASAIASNLALGFNLQNSVKKANGFIDQAIRKNFIVGKGSSVLGFF